MKSENRQAGDRENQGGFGRRSLWLATAALVAVVGLIIGSALAASRAEAGWGRERWGHHGHGEFDSERMKEHAEYAVAFVLGRLDASDEQEARIVAIVNETIDGMAKGADEHRARRDALTQLFAQPEIDRDALEALRRAELQLADDVSAQIVSAIADVAEVLTLEQRAELMEMHARLGRWH